MFFLAVPKQARIAILFTKKHQRRIHFKSTSMSNVPTLLSTQKRPKTLTTNVTPCMLEENASVPVSRPISVLLIFKWSQSTC